ncbi:unnamed protein product [Camellia sinensis]
MGSETLSAKLPTVEFTGENLKPGKSSWIATCHEVRRALEEYGCFVAVYERVDLELDEAIFSELEELFDLPTETKVQNTSDVPYFGYVGQLPDIPLYESMGISDPQTLQGTQTFTKLMWPAGNDKFCETVCSYSKLVSQLEQTVKRMVFESYGVEKCFENHDIGSTSYLLKATKYKAPKMNEMDIGLTSHTDKSFITILHQNQVNGLEVKSNNGEWIGFDEHLPSSFVVMAGDAFMAWSNNRIHSPSHRVVMRGDKTRYSLGLFSINKGTIHIPRELVDEQHPLQFHPFDNLGLLLYSYADVYTRSESCIKDYCGI